MRLQAFTVLLVIFIASYLLKLNTEQFTIAEHKTKSKMPVTRINVKERDIIRLVLEFMNTR